MPPSSVLTALALALAPCPTTRELTAPSARPVQLAYELTLPDSPASPRPVIVLISGAGAFSRDYSTDAGNDESGNHAFVRLRDRLARAGYAVVLFDERGTGRSTGDYDATATTSTLADDVAALIRHVRSQPGVDSTRIILLGHSEGGAIATLVASRSAHVHGIITLGAPAWTGRRIMDWQHEREIAHGEWAPHLSSRESRIAVLDRIHAHRVATDPWYRFFLDYDPLAAAREVGVPTLILQGGLDTKVSAGQASELADAARAAGAEVTLRLLPHHDHAFGAPGLGSLPGRLSDEVPTEVLAWLGRVFPKPAARLPACRASSSAASNNPRSRGASRP